MFKITSFDPYDQTCFENTTRYQGKKQTRILKKKKTVCGLYFIPICMLLFVGTYIPDTSTGHVNLTISGAKYIIGCGNRLYCIRINVLCIIYGTWPTVRGLTDRDFCGEPPRQQWCAFGMLGETEKVKILDENTVSRLCNFHIIIIVVIIYY